MPRSEIEGPSTFQLAGLADESLNVTGTTFDRLREEYSKIGIEERNKMLAALQLRVAALYAVQMDDAQTNPRRDTATRLQRELDHHNPMETSARRPSRRRSRHADISSHRDEEAEQLQHLRNSNEASLEDPLMSSPFTLDQQHQQTSMPDLALPQFQQYLSSPKRSRARPVNGTAQHPSG